MTESSIERGTSHSDHRSMEGWLLAMFYLPGAKRMVLHHSLNGDYEDDSLYLCGLTTMHLFRAVAWQCKLDSAPR